MSEREGEVEEQDSGNSAPNKTTFQPTHAHRDQIYAITVVSDYFIHITTSTLIPPDFRTVTHVPCNIKIVLAFISLIYDVLFSFSGMCNIKIHIKHV